MTKEELLDEGSWDYAFQEVGANIDDVQEVIATDVEYGDYAETDVVGLFELKNGRFLVVSASCDTTGWDCRASGTCSEHDTLEDAKIHGLTADERTRLFDKDNQ